LSLNVVYPIGLILKWNDMKVKKIKKKVRCLKLLVKWNKWKQTEIWMWSYGCCNLGECVKMHILLYMA